MDLPPCADTAAGRTGWQIPGHIVRGYSLPWGMISDSEDDQVLWRNFVNAVLIGNRENCSGSCALIECVQIGIDDASFTTPNRILSTAKVAIEVWIDTKGRESTIGRDFNRETTSCR